jgi:hypothetical protein
VFHDTAADSDPHPAWASIQCASSTRYRYMTSGGDPLATATGALQGNSSFRRLTVLDGDNFWGERCELGRNDWRTSPTTIYHEGQHRVTFMSLHLPSNFPLSTTTWQVVMQMKQSQPSNNGGGTPVLSLEARANQWRLMQSNSENYSSNTHQLWSAPAQTGHWTRFAFDVIYSEHASAGYVKAYVDLDGDGDATDAGEQSSGLRTYTLKRETSDSTYLKAGASIPSQLRVGMYHNSTISCPSGCSVDVDNVQVLNVP